MKITAIKMFDVSSLFFILVLLSVVTECSSVNCCCDVTLFLPAEMIEWTFSENIFNVFWLHRRNRERNVLSVSSIGNFCMSFCMRRMQQRENIKVQIVNISIPRMIISGTLSVERKSEDRKIAKDMMFMMSQMDSIFLSLILGSPWFWGYCLTFVEMR